MWASDILINLASDFIFVAIVLIVLGLLYLASWSSHLGAAARFYGFSRRNPVKIYVPSIEHPNTSSKATVTVVEYESAVETRRRLQELGGANWFHRLVQFLAGLLGVEISIPAPQIEISPLGEVQGAHYRGPVISIGGPVTNQLTRFYLGGSPQYRWDFDGGCYQEWVDGAYRSIEPSAPVAIIEKRIIDGQTAILVHGYGEADTARAVQHLLKNWRQLSRSHGTGEFAVRV